MKENRDVDIMFEALFAIISDPEIDTLEKCMQVAHNAIDSLLDKSIIDKKAESKCCGRCIDGMDDMCIYDKQD